MIRSMAALDGMGVLPGRSSFAFHHATGFPMLRGSV
jgi:hypothetical protein